jgi:hypothetical protein
MLIRLNPSDPLAALMRVQVAALRQKTRLPKPPTRRPAQGSTPTKAVDPDLATVAAERIRAIAPDDPDRNRKVLRIFLESVLLAELGPELVSDPAFARMVDYVQQQVEGNPELGDSARQAAEILLNSAAAGQ